MKIAANLSMLFTELPLAERIMAARIAGFDGVEIQFPYELPALQLKELLERAGLPLVLINLPAGDFMQGGADRKSTRLNSSHMSESRMPSSA